MLYQWYHVHVVLYPFLARHVGVGKCCCCCTCVWHLYARLASNVGRGGGSHGPPGTSYRSGGLVEWRRRKTVWLALSTGHGVGTRNSREALPRNGDKGGVVDLVWPESPNSTIQTTLFRNSRLTVIFRISGWFFIIVFREVSTVRLEKKKR